MLRKFRQTGTVCFILLFLFLFPVRSMADSDRNTLKTVVIDPGHGGIDPGANIGTVYEKDIVLSIALKAGQLIKRNHQGVNVVYTRDKDVFIPLSERAEIANKAKADLFISIHLNYCSTEAVAGAETYILGQHRSKENLEVAKMENSVILLEEDYTTRYEGFDPNSSESYIMFEMIQNEFLEQSRQFAEKLQTTFVNKAKRPDRGVRQAGFLVIRRTSMPSVLAELGFMSNKQELKYVQSVKGQSELAHAIFDAFTDFKIRYDERAGIIALKETEAKSESVTPSSITEMKDSIVDLSLMQGTFYGIQILAVKDFLKANDSRFKSEKPVYFLLENGLYKYIIGLAPEKEIINHSLNTKRQNFKDCFPVKIENGVKVPFR